MFVKSCLCSCPLPSKRELKWVHGFHPVHNHLLDDDKQSNYIHHKVLVKLLIHSQTSTVPKFGMYEQFILTTYVAYDHLPMLWLELIRLSKRNPWCHYASIHFQINWGTKCRHESDSGAPREIYYHLNLPCLIDFKIREIRLFYHFSMPR